MSNPSTRLHHALPTAGGKHNGYCGPAALAALAGISTGDAARVLREVGGHRAIRGTSDRTMLDALQHEGLEVVQVCRPRPKPTLRAWLRLFYRGERTLVCAGSHWWALDGECYVDTFNRLPTPIVEIRQPRARVETAYVLEWSELLARSA